MNNQISGNRVRSIPQRMTGFSPNGGYRSRDPKEELWEGQVRQ